MTLQIICENDNNDLIISLVDEVKKDTSRLCFYILGENALKEPNTIEKLQPIWETHIGEINNQAVILHLGAKTFGVQLGATGHCDLKTKQQERLNQFIDNAEKISGAYGYWWDSTFQLMEKIAVGAFRTYDLELVFFQNTPENSPYYFNESQLITWCDIWRDCDHQVDLSIVTPSKSNLSFFKKNQVPLMTLEQWIDKQYSNHDQSLSGEHHIEIKLKSNIELPDPQFCAPWNGIINKKTRCLLQANIVFPITKKEIVQFSGLKAENIKTTLSIQ